MVILCAVALVGISSTARAESDEEALNKLKRIIEEQQDQIDAQQKILQDLKQQVEALGGR
jgi:septal ring factor EnvC (AmiA/AmiB activator)